MVFEPSLATGPLTPLLVQGGGLAPVVKGELGDGVAGYVGTLSYERFRYTAGLTEIKESVSLVPRLQCERIGRWTSDTHYGFEVRNSRLWTESVALNGRYKVTTSPWQDPNWMRQLFSAAMIDWLSTTPPDDFSFELTYGWLLCSLERDSAGEGELDWLRGATAFLAARVRQECLE
jgi:hypothetical protein